MENKDNLDLLEEYPRALFMTVMSAYSNWLAVRLAAILGGVHSREIPRDVVESCAREAATELFDLLRTDVDDQRVNPLQVLRDSTDAATKYLENIGVPPAKRDEFESAAMPRDIFAIGPLTWKDLNAEVHEAGITWGAWKAATIITRRRQEGKIS